MNKKTRNIISTIINGIIVLSALICLIVSIIPGTKYFMNISTFKYYTNLSNIFLAVSCAIMLFFNIKSIVKKEVIISKFAVLAKYYAVITTTITFVVVITFLGPMISYKAMFNSFVLVFFHAINPIIGLLSFLLIDNKTKIGFKHTLYAFISTGSYAIFYLTYYLITKDDFYKFFENGIGILILITVMILGFNFGQAVLYRYLTNKSLKELSK